MSEYRWRVKRAWIGVKNEEGELIGVIIRSGTVQACGHFCFVDIQVNGQKYTASGAEDRIFPFHSITLKPGDKRPDLLLDAIGWCVDGNTYAFRTVGKESDYLCRLVDRFDKGDEAFEPVSFDMLKDKAKERLAAVLKERSNPCPTKSTKSRRKTPPPSGGGSPSAGGSPSGGP